MLSDTVSQKNMDRLNKVFFLLMSMSLVAAALLQAEVARAQILDQLMNRSRQSTNQTSKIERQEDVGPVRSGFRDMMSVSVPAIYEMVKSGRTLGINVLSGLVRVDRGEEAERSGLTGRRPLSVRVFGVPVYERGQRFKDIDDESPPPGRGGGSSSGSEPKVDEVDDEELPINP